MSKYLSISLIIVSLVVGLALGYSFTPQYIYFAQAGSHTQGLGKADRWLDLRLMNGLVAHHLSAIDMLTQVKNKSTRGELIGLAEAIIPADQAEIKVLNAWRLEWYGQKKEVSRFNKVNLGEAGDNFDLRFLNAMIAHHEEAIATLKEARGKSTRQEILTLIDGTLLKLEGGVKALKDWRQAWYNVAI